MCNTGFNLTMSSVTNQTTCTCSAPFAIDGSICTCPAGTFADNDTCLQECNNLAYCQICSGTTVCAQCFSGFILSAGVCINQCSIANCTSCDSAVAGVCTQCSSNVSVTLTVSADGMSCISCDVNNCQSCS